MKQGPKIEQPVADGESKPLPLTALGARHCRWPISQDTAQIGGFMFCARPTDDASPYCAHHHRIARQPAFRGAVKQQVWGILRR